MTSIELYLLSYQYESYSAMSIDLGIRYKELIRQVKRGKAEYNARVYPLRPSECCKANDNVITTEHDNSPKTRRFNQIQRNDLQGCAR